MKFNTCFLFLLLGVTLIQSDPIPKITEKKSLAENSKSEDTKENVKIEETGEDKDRSKKAAFCLQIEPGSPQAAQFALNENQLAIQNIPLTVQTASVPQQIQSLNLVQPIPQPLSQANIVLPQQVVPIHTLQFVQPPAQPCAQSTPSAQTIQKLKPKLTPATESLTDTEQPKPVRIEKPPQSLPAPQEALTVLPIVPAYQEHLMLFSEPEQATFVQVPSVSACSNPLHGLVTECTCQKMEPMAMNMIPVMPYPSTYTRSPMVMPHTVTNQVKTGPQGRTHTYVNVNVPSHSHHPHHLHQTMYQKTYLRGLDSEVNPYLTKELIDNTYATKGITINAYPQSFRGMNSVVQPTYQFPGNSLRNTQNVLGNTAPSEVYDLMSTNKAPREADSNQLSPEKTEEVKEEGKVMLIDGRRNARSNKEEAKSQKKQLTKN